MMLVTVKGDVQQQSALDSNTHCQVLIVRRALFAMQARCSGEAACDSHFGKGTGGR